MANWLLDAAAQVECRRIDKTNAWSRTRGTRFVPPAPKPETAVERRRRLRSTQEGLQALLGQTLRQGRA